MFIDLFVCASRINLFLVDITLIENTQANT